MQNLVEQLEKERRRVDFDTFDISVNELVGMAENKIIDIAPDYQRQFRWPPKNQSRFIESVFLGIPIPSLFMAANRDGSWELIDGVQRLCSLIHFVGNRDQLKMFDFEDPLKLKGLDILSKFEGKIFDDLPSSMNLKFKLRPIKITTLSDKSDKKVRFDLFERLNTGGVRLTSQEIRSCVYKGRFNDFLKELSEDKSFNKVVNLPDSKQYDGTKEELVLKFFSYLNNREEFEHSVIGFLNQYMDQSSKAFDYRDGNRIFTKTFSQLSQALPSGIKRGNRSMTPVNLFEAVSVGAAEAVREGIDISNSNISEWIEREELKKLTSGATNSRKRLKERIDYCYKKFVEENV